MIGFNPNRAALGCASNISDMSELAEIARHLLRFSPDALVVVDEQGLIRFANDTVTNLFGYSPEQLIGQSIDTLVPERLRARHMQHVASFIAKPRSREMGAAIGDLFALRADGTEFAAGIRLAHFNIEDKLYIAAAIRDNTERKVITDELVAARQEAERANRAKSRFLATASHDLRQPLQTVRMLNASMCKLAEDARLTELLKHQEQAIDNATRLLNALLDISRLESGGIEPQCTEVSLPDLFDELRNEFESVARARDLQLRLEPLAVVLQTDRILIYQLLQNLLGNALKYTDRGWVSVKAGLDEAGLKIVVRDTGIGIPADKVERIFDEYYQVDTHGAKRVGVGLGLAIVKEVARLLDCDVAIRSRLGEGTEVTVTLPPSAVAAGPPASADHDQKLAPTAYRKARVILVEDNEGVRVATELFLKLEGFETLCATSVADAERLIPTIRRGDVIVADYHLDRTCTGLDVLEQVRSRTGIEVPGVVLSGDLPAAVRSKLQASSNTRFLSKPVDTKILLETISELSKAS